MANWVSSFLQANPGVVVARRARHALHVQQGNDLIAHFTGMPCHFFSGGVWQPIDTVLGG